MKFHFVALVRTVVLLLAPVLSAHAALMLGPGDATATSDEEGGRGRHGKSAAGQERGFHVEVAPLYFGCKQTAGWDDPAVASVRASRTCHVVR